MKTIEKKYFVCQVCGKSSTKEKVIMDCEKKHRVITDDCIAEAVFSRGQEYPGLLNITFPDGSQATYSYEFHKEAVK